MANSWASQAAHLASDAEVEAGRSALAGLFVPGQKFIFNPDLDGILAAGLLQKHLGWIPHGVAACNGEADDAFWTAGSSWQEDDAVFVDMWVHPPAVRVLDQHITAYDDAHHRQLAANPNKVNPNLFWPRTLHGTGSREYRWKYPFGVVHFVLAGLEAAGFQVALPNAQLDGFTVFDLLLRADDASFSTAAKYRSNALGWWDLLVRMGGPTTSAIAEHAVSLKLPEAEQRKQAVESWLQQVRRPVTARGPKDGGFASAIRAQDAWTIEMAAYTDAILQPFGLPSLRFAGPLVRQRLQGDRIYPNSPQVPAVLQDNRLFAYAFTSSLQGRQFSPGFSYARR